MRRTTQGAAIAVLFALTVGPAAGSSGAARHAAPADPASASLASPGSDPRRAAGDSSSAAELAATHEEPWNPPKPVSSAEPWEVAVRAPLRVATLPLKLLNYVGERAVFQAERSSVVPRIQFYIAVMPRVGLYVGPASLGDRTGLGGAFRYRPPALDSIAGVEIQGSTRKYSRFEGLLERGPASIAYRNEWRPRDRFFGFGLGSSDEQPSSFAYRTQRVEAALAYPWQHRRQPPPRRQLRAWAGPREMILRRGRENPSFDQRFAPTASLLNQRQEHFVYGLSATSDERSGLPHWTRGWRAMVGAERFDRAIESLTLRDAHTDSPQFTRLTFFGEAGVSFWRDPRTVRLAIRAVDLKGANGTAPLLLPDLATLGGNQGLSGFEPGRYHDRDLVVGKLMYIFPLTRNLEFEVHAETGGVYDRLDEARLSTFKNSYGWALRPRLDTGPLGSFGFDWSAETLRIRYSLGGVE